MNYLTVMCLYIVRNWEFLLPQPAALTSSWDKETDPRKFFQRRSSLVVADLPLKSHLDTTNITGSDKPLPDVFQEPQPNSLLDSFGF